jgi:hypothetical protein
MGNCVMSQQDIPEVIVGSGKSQISLRGRDAIRAAGWALPLLLFARAVKILLFVPIGGIVFLLLKWLLS